MTNKKFLTWFLILSGVLLVIVALGAWIIYSYVSRTFFRSPKTPSELVEARIIRGAELLSRNQFVTTGPGSIQDIAIGELDSHPGIDVVIAGRYGVMVFDRNGVKQSQVQYDFETEKIKVLGTETESRRTMLGNLQIIDIEGDGTCEYLARGSLNGAAVFDHTGKRLWSYGAFTEEKTSIGLGLL